MRHLNDDIMCCVRAMTSGPDPSCQSIVHFICVPMLELDPHPSKLLFEIWMKPKYQDLDMDYVEDYQIKGDMYTAITKGVDAETGALMFESWVCNLGLRPGKKIVPLAHNWFTLYPFLLEWLSFTAYNEIFSWDYRDIIPAANFVNDKQHFNRVKYSYAHRMLLSLSNSARDMDTPRQKSLAAEASVIIQTYKAMVNKTIGVL